MEKTPTLPTLPPDSPRLAQVRHAARGEVPGLTVVDGEKLVQDLALAGVPFEMVLLSAERLEPGGELVDLLARKMRGQVYSVSAAALDQVAPTQHSQGVLAVVKIPERQIPVAGVVVFLDRVQDPGNVGAVVRSAAAFGASGVACSAGCADPFSPRAVRASSGWCLRVPVACDVAFSGLAARFVAAGGDVVATLGAGGTPLQSWRAGKPLLLALGNEGQGLDAEVLSACNGAVTVPLSRGVESLNVAVTAGVVLAFLAGLAVTPILESKV